MDIRKERYKHMLRKGFKDLEKVLPRSQNPNGSSEEEILRRAIATIANFKAKVYSSSIEIARLQHKIKILDSVKDAALKSVQCTGTVTPEVEDMLKQLEEDESSSDVSNTDSEIDSWFYAASDCTTESAESYLDESDYTGESDLDDYTSESDYTDESDCEDYTNESDYTGESNLEDYSNESDYTSESENAVQNDSYVRPSGSGIGTKTLKCNVNSNINAYSEELVRLIDSDSDSQLKETL